MGIVLYRLMFFEGGGGLTDRDPRLLKLASSGGATVFRLQAVSSVVGSCWSSAALQDSMGVMLGSNHCCRAGFVVVRPGLTSF